MKFHFTRRLQISHSTQHNPRSKWGQCRQRALFLPLRCAPPNQTSLQRRVRGAPVLSLRYHWPLPQRGWDWIQPSSQGHLIQGARHIPGHECFSFAWCLSNLHVLSKMYSCIYVPTSYADKLDLFLAGLAKSRPFQCGLRMVKSELGRYQWFRFEEGGTGPYHALQLYE